MINQSLVTVFVLHEGNRATDFIQAWYGFRLIIWHKFISKMKT